LLKGWSNHGETTYINFDYPERIYPKPSRYPFDASLTELIKARELTYNWNTKGVGYTVESGATRILALYRSVALPVSYIAAGPGRADTQSVNDAEERAYGNFAESGDPNLVRVVQYAAMYQIFSAFDIAHSSHTVVKDAYPSQRIEALTGELNAKLLRLPADEQNDLATKAAPILIGAMFEDELARMNTRYLEEARKQIDADLRKQWLPPDSTEYKTAFNKRFDKFKSDMAKANDLSRTLFLREVETKIKQELVAIKQNRAPKD